MSEPARAGEEGLRLTANDVHVWMAVLEATPPAAESVERILAVEERERAARFHFDHDRNRWMKARLFLRDVLSRYTGSAPRELRFSFGAAGKPELEFPGREPRFNLSHSHERALLAVASGRRVGVDVERQRPDYTGDDVAARFFSAAEVTAYQSFTVAERHAVFYRCWTRKEAYVKARGEALAARLRRFAVSLDDEETARVLHDDDDPDGVWRLMGIRMDEEYSAALAVEGGGFRLSHWMWRGESLGPEAAPGFGPA